jgi:hypothetical protein
MPVLRRNDRSKYVAARDCCGTHKNCLEEARAIVMNGHWRDASRRFARN